MVRISVAQMNSKLVELNTFFTKNTEQFTYQISKHEGRLTQKDYKDFQHLINQIKEQALVKITNFMNTRITERSQSYEREINSYTQAHNQVDNDLRNFSQYLENCTIQLKEKQNRQQKVLDNLSKKFCENLFRKRAIKALVNYKNQRQHQKQLQAKMDSVYQKNLLKKSFFPWRTLTYKQGYQNSVRRQTENDIQNIHSQYNSIIDILKTKIMQTENLTKVKKAAKGQFTYALSKNLLKTISNLSLQVMSLNQISLRDQQFQNSNTEQFMRDVNGVIKEKLERVREYKREISGADDQEVKRKKITFV